MTQWGESTHSHLVYNHNVGLYSDHVYLQYALSYLRGMDYVSYKNHNIEKYPDMYIFYMFLHICNKLTVYYKTHNALSYLHGMDSVFYKNHNLDRCHNMYVFDMVLHICSKWILLTTKITILVDNPTMFVY